MIIGNLEVNSFTYIGSVGARHFFGKVVYYDNDIRNSFQIVRLLSREEAKELNEIDNITEKLSQWRCGDECERFDTERDVIVKGISMFKQKFPQEVLFRGSASCMSAIPLIYWPEKYSKIATKINLLAEEWDHIGGYEGNKKRAEKIDEQFYKLYQHLRNNKGIGKTSKNSNR